MFESRLRASLQPPPPCFLQQPLPPPQPQLHIESEIVLPAQDKATFDLHYAAHWASLHRQHLAHHAQAAATLRSTISSAASLDVGGAPAATDVAAPSASLIPSQFASGERASFSSSSAATSTAASAVTAVPPPPPPPLQPRGGRPSAEYNHLFALNHRERPPFESTTLGSANRERDRRQLFDKFGVLPENGSRTAHLYAADGALLAVGYLRLMFGDDGPFFELTHSNVNWQLFGAENAHAMHRLRGLHSNHHHQQQLQEQQQRFHEHIHIGRVKALKTRAMQKEERDAARRKWESSQRESLMHFFQNRDREHEESEREKKRVMATATVQGRAAYESEQLMSLVRKQQEQMSALYQSARLGASSSVGGMSSRSNNNNNYYYNNNKCNSSAAAAMFAFTSPGGGTDSDCFSSLLPQPAAAASSFSGLHPHFGADEIIEHNVSSNFVNGAPSTLQQMMQEDAESDRREALGPAPKLQTTAVIREQFRDVRDERNPPSADNSTRVAGAGHAAAAATAGVVSRAAKNYRLDGYADYVPGRLYISVDSVARVVVPSLTITPECILESILGKETQKVQELQQLLASGISSGRASTRGSSDNTSNDSKAFRVQQQRAERLESIDTAMRFLGDIEHRPFELFRELVGSRLGGEGAGAAIYSMGAVLRLVDHDPVTAKRFLVLLRILDAATSSSKQQQLSERRITQLLTATPLFVRCPDLSTQHWLVDKERATVGPGGEMSKSPHRFDAEEETARRRIRRVSHPDEWMYQQRGAIAAAVAYCECEHRGRLCVVLLVGRGVELAETPREDAATRIKKRLAQKQEEENQRRLREEEEEEEEEQRRAARASASDDAAAVVVGATPASVEKTAETAAAAASGLTGDALLDDALEFEQRYKRGGGGGAGATSGFVSRFAASIRSGNQSVSAAVSPSSPAALLAAKKRQEAVHRQQQLLAIRRQRQQQLLMAKTKAIVDEEPRPFRFFLSFDTSVVNFLDSHANDAGNSSNHNANSHHFHHQRDLLAATAAMSSHEHKTRILDESVSIDEIGSACWSCVAGPDRPLVSSNILPCIFSIEWPSQEAFIASVGRNQGTLDADSLETLVMSNIQREKKMLMRKKELLSTQQQHQQQKNKGGDGDVASQVSVSASFCPRFAARQWFWHSTAMVLNGEQQARFLQTPAEFPARLRYPSWWSFQFLDGVRAKSLREKLHAIVAAKVKPLDASAAFGSSGMSNPHSLAARTGTAELTHAQKMIQQRQRKLGLSGSLAASSALPSTLAHNNNNHDLEDSFNTSGLLRKTATAAAAITFPSSSSSSASTRLLNARATAAEEDLTPYTGLEHFFRDGTYDADSEFTANLMSKGRTRGLNAATRLGLGISATTVLPPKLILKHAEKVRAQELFERQLREQQALEEEKLRKQEELEAEQRALQDEENEDSGSSSSDGDSTHSQPIADDANANKVEGKQRGKEKSLSGALSLSLLASSVKSKSGKSDAINNNNNNNNPLPRPATTTTSVPAPSLSIASPRGTSSQHPQHHQRSTTSSASASFIFTVEDTAVAGGGPLKTNLQQSANGSTSTAAATASAATTGAELIGFCKGTVEFVHSCSSAVPAERIAALIGAAAGNSSTSHVVTNWVVLRIDSLLVGERKLDPRTFDRAALAKREEEDRKAAADPFYVPQYSSNNNNNNSNNNNSNNNSGSLGMAAILAAEEQEARWKSLKRKPFARMDVAMFIVKALFETFRSPEGGGAEHVFLIASVDREDADPGDSQYREDHVHDSVQQPKAPPTNKKNSACNLLRRKKRQEKLSLAQQQLQEHFSLRSLSTSRSFWMHVLGCASFAPPVMKRRFNQHENGDADDEADEEFVFHMFSE